MLGENMFYNMKRVLLKSAESIRSKIIIIMVLLILPLNLLAITSTRKAIDVVKDQASLTMDSVTIQYMQRLDNYIEQIHYYFYDISENDEDFIRLSKQKKSDSYYLSQTAIAEKFRTRIMTTSGGDGYFYYGTTQNDFLLVMPNTILGMSAVEFRTVRDQLQTYLTSIEWEEISSWSIIELNEYKWLMCVYNTENFHYGALISLDEICNQVRDAVDYKNMMVTLDMKKPVSIENRLSSIKKSDKIDLYLSMSVPKKDVVLSLPMIQWITIVLSFAYLLLIPLLINILNHILIRPLNKIKNALQRLKSGDQDYRISAHRYAEEFRVINQSFNDMADRIEDLKIENYEKEVDRQKMKLQNLQLQIRPHFLLNMFKLVYSLAQIQEFKSIQQLALYLSDYFRYIFRSEKELEPFYKEFQLIQDYLKVAAIRYPDCFTIEYQVQVSVMKIEVPPLLIHNFIENIFDHALGKSGMVHIVLKAKYEMGLVEIVIEDDGTGISEDIIKDVNQEIFSLSKKGRVHVGLYNSLQRLRHFYGNESSIRVSSEPERKTRFVIQFPYKKEDQNESTDC